MYAAIGNGEAVSLRITLHRRFDRRLDCVEPFQCLRPPSQGGARSLGARS